MSEEEQTMEIKDKSKDEEIAELKAKIKELEKQNSYEEIKEKYAKAMELKDAEIEELKNNNKELASKNDEALDKLGQEVQERLEANEKFKKMEETIREMEIERANVSVDTLVKKGVILGKQKESAKKLFLENPDLFEELYSDAAPVIDVNEKPKAKRINNIAKGLDYLVE